MAGFCFFGDDILVVILLRCFLLKSFGNGIFSRVLRLCDCFNRFLLDDFICPLGYSFFFVVGVCLKVFWRSYVSWFYQPLYRFTVLSRMFFLAKLEEFLLWTPQLTM